MLHTGKEIKILHCNILWINKWYLKWYIVQTQHYILGIVQKKKKWQQHFLFSTKYPYVITLIFINTAFQFIIMN